MRNFNFIDELFTGFDNVLRIIIPPQNRVHNRVSPSADIPEHNLKDNEKRHVAGLMRVNHAGEVAAQALYQGQAYTAQLLNVKEQMQKAAEEEIDHLAWCEERLTELNANPSILNPLWYVSSFMVGALAGIVGDKFSLGFVVETERQVVKHLQNHFAQVSASDLKTKAILLQMEKDESEHAASALQAGAHELPSPIKFLMQLTSKLLTKTSYYI